MKQIIQDLNSINLGYYANMHNAFLHKFKDIFKQYIVIL